MRSRGTGELSWPIRSISSAAFWLRDRCAYSIEIDYCGRQLVFRCRSRRALSRAATLFIKEQGTIEWLQNNVREGDLVLDIGANVGMYSILAAERVGDSGHVFAIEPHLFNAAALLENVAINRFTHRVSVLTLALGREVSFDTFNYREWEIGSSFSQLGNQKDKNGHDFQPVAREWKSVATVDSLISQGTIQPPTLIKLDVDGLEPAVLGGMQELLRGNKRPRSIQVEVSPANRTEIEAIMAQSGFRVESRHHTKAGKKRMRRGAGELETDHNAIFVPA
jgi:FkbM family methyltransferase